MKSTEVKKTAEDIPSRVKRLESALNASTDNETKNRLLQEIIDLSRLVAISTLPSFSELLRTIRMLCFDQERIIRMQCLRVLRYLVTDIPSMKAMIKMNLDLFVVRTLERPNHKDYKLERVQALKIVIRLLEISPKIIPRTIVQSMVLIMSKRDDDLRRVCMDRVRELAFHNPSVVASTNGVFAMVKAILDSSCSDIAGQLTMTLLYLLDQHSTRKYLRPHIHIQYLLSVFTDTDSPETQDKEARREAAHKALMIIMRSWTGIFILASDKQGLRSLVEILNLPSSFNKSSWSKDAVFLLLINILSVVKSEDLATHKSKGIWKSLGPNLLHSYVVMVLLAFIESGLVPILARIGMEQESEMSGVATNLLREILHLSADLLPSEPWGVQLNALPMVMNCAASFDTKRIVSRVLARDMLLKMSYAQSELKPDTKERRLNEGFEYEATDKTFLQDLEEIALKSDSNSMARSQGREQTMPRIVTSRRAGQGQLMAMHRRITTSSEEVVNRLMTESGVVGNREHTAWDWDKCLYLLEGPLSNPQYLVSIFRNSKFIKRLLLFIRPSKQAFAIMAWKLENMRCAKVACQLFRVLCLTKETAGSRLFSDVVREILDELLAEATRGKNSLQMSSRTHARSPSTASVNEFMGGMFSQRKLRPFNRESVTERLAREYFTLIGIVTSSRLGAELVRDKLMPGTFYSDLYNLYKDPAKDYLARLILSSFSYGNENKNQRTLLDIWVKQGSVNLRKYAVAHLRVLLRDKSLDTLSHFWQWGVRLLASQLIHPNEELALSALSVLEEVCQDEKCLEYLIKFAKPKFVSIGAAANNLQTKFLSMRSGVIYLQKIDWIDLQMQLWMSEGNRKYVEAVENALVGAFDTGMHIPKVKRNEMSPTIGAQESSHKHHRPEYGYGFGGIHFTIRTEYDDYYFSRLHRIPWKVSISLEYPSRDTFDRKAEGGSSYGILCEAFVHTVPHFANTVYKRRTTTPKVSSRFSDSSHDPEAMYAETPNGLETYVAAVVITDNGIPKKQKVDDVVNIRASLSVGSVQTPHRGRSAFANRHYEQVCTPLDRQRLIETRKGVFCVETKQARWNFVRKSSNSRHTTSIRKVTSFNRFADNGERLYLESVWFKLPTPNSSKPVVCLAPHFFGELAKTEEGCKIIEDSGHMEHFVRTVMAPVDAKEDEIIPEEKQKKDSEEVKISEDLNPSNGCVSAVDQRAALWALGQIGSSGTGFKLLSTFDSKIVKYISDMALTCPTLSLKGTCFYIMGLLSRNELGRESLRKLGWRTSPNVDVGIVIPKDTTKFFTVDYNSYKGSWPHDPENTFGLEHVPLKNASLPQTTLKKDYSNADSVILGHLSNLCNSVTIKPSLNELRRLRKEPRARRFFKSTEMLYKVFKMVSTYDFQLDARRCIFNDLFNISNVKKEDLKIFDKPLNVDDSKLKRPQLYHRQTSSQSSRRSKLTPKKLTTTKSIPEKKAIRPKMRLVGFANDNAADHDDT